MEYKYFARVIVEKDGKLLVIHNIKDGRNRWEFPGGKLDEGETFMSAAVRELHEETGLMTATKYLKWVSSPQIEIDNGNWVGVIYATTEWAGEPKIMEPEKFDGLKWVTLEELEKLPQIPYLTYLVAKRYLMHRKFQMIQERNIKGFFKNGKDQLAMEDK